MPTEEMLFNIAQDFYLLWDMPHCFGAIDGCHIDIKKPANTGKLHFNYKQYFSTVLQAVVDAHCKFISIDVGGYGSQHDATTYRKSTFYKALMDTTIKIPEDDELPNSDIILPYFLIGDGAYPISENLMKPYPGKGLPQDKIIFNKRLSRARSVVECAFGRLFQKWQIFYTTIQPLPETVELIVKAACILYNVIIDLEGDIDETQQSQSSNAASSPVCDDQYECLSSRGLGQEVRDELRKYFMQNPI